MQRLWSVSSPFNKVRCHDAAVVPASLQSSRHGVPVDVPKVFGRRILLLFLMSYLPKSAVPASWCTQHQQQSMHVQARSGDILSSCLLPAGVGPVEGTELASEKRVREVRRLVTHYANYRQAGIQHLAGTPTSWLRQAPCTLEMSCCRQSLKLARPSRFASHRRLWRRPQQQRRHLSSKALWRYCRCCPSIQFLSSYGVLTGAKHSAGGAGSACLRCRPGRRCCITSTRSSAGACDHA